MRRVLAGTAICPRCREAIRPDEEVVITPDFLVDDADPFWPFADAAFHRACFLTWERRKGFIARYNRLGRQLVAEDGSYPQMTAEGAILQRAGKRPSGRGPAS